MQPRHHDGLLALTVLAAVAVLAAGLGYEPAALLRPLPAIAGVVGALAFELLVARYPERSRDCWYRRDVQAASILLVVIGGGLLAALAGPWVLTTLGAGLLTYLAMLVLVLVGAIPGAERWFDGS